mgnify:CR=1 FL=1
MKILGDKPLIQYSIDFALNNFSKDAIWVNSDDQEIIEFSKEKGIKTLERPDCLATDFASTADVLKFQVNYLKEQNIACDAIILLQPTNPFREDNLLKEAIEKFQESKRNSLATFSISEKKLGKIEGGLFKPTNYTPGQRSQDLEKIWHDTGTFYFARVREWMSEKFTFNNRSIGLEIKPTEAQDIDDEYDWKLAEMKYSLMHGNQNG